MSKKMANKPLIIGLTGSIGMGKSTIANMFADEGIAVFDADAAVHKLQGPGGLLLEDIEKLFPGTTGPDGVDRPKLGKMVLGHPEKLKKLEQLVHPAVARMRSAFLAEHAGDDMIVFDIPLLFEKGGAESVDVILVVSASGHIQRERVLSRPAMDEDRFEQILSLQTPDHEKRARAHHIIDTGQSIEATRADLKNFIETLRRPLA